MSFPLVDGPFFEDVPFFDGVWFEIFEGVMVVFDVEEDGVEEVFVDVDGVLGGDGIGRGLLILEFFFVCLDFGVLLFEG